MAKNINCQYKLSTTVSNDHSITERVQVSFVSLDLNIIIF